MKEIKMTGKPVKARVGMNVLCCNLNDDWCYRFGVPTFTIGQKYKVLEVGEYHITIKDNTGCQLWISKRCFGYIKK